MDMVEIILLLAGGVLLILGIFIPEGKKIDPDLIKTEKEHIKRLVEAEVKNSRSKMEDIVEEELAHGLEKTERALERISNEKIMSVNEYSDTVLEEIHKAHKEVLFMYEMLSEKQDSLKALLSEFEKMKKERSLQQNVSTSIEKELLIGQNEKMLTEESSNKNLTKNISIPIELVSQGATSLFETDRVPVNGFGDEKTIKGNNSKIDSNDEIKKELLQVSDGTKSITNLKSSDNKPSKKTEATKTTNKTTANKTTANKTTANKRKATAPKKESQQDKVSLIFQDAPVEGKNRNEYILELHKSGKSNMAIAKELGLGIGEIKLVIDLYEGV